MFNPYAASPKKKPGDQFLIIHCDGYRAYETVSYIRYVPTGDYWLYVCESAAVYSCRDIAN